MKIISWNIVRRIAPWHRLLEVGADIALLQEAAAPPPEVTARIDADPAPWDTPGVDAQRKWRTAVVRLSECVQVDWIEAKPLLDAGWGELAVSRPGTIAAAKVTPADGELGEPLVVVSMYGLWAGPHASTGNSWIVADDSVHRAVSDLSAFIGSQQGHRILTAGDLNILYGYGDHGNTYWAGRYEAVFARMDALGLAFVGPQAPNGRQAGPWPGELPPDSKNVPTYHSTRQTPETATRQLDFVFASKSLASSVTVRALNEPDRWGPSDHCVVEIVVG